ncbi:MAG: polyhydroxyalkanoate synthesis regulator DNA-binding domain-containing protein [Proteobacteria bacterium]|nr:polyhydroxyalkanoate synthesis regulator DNA-binding domain-containing protein [Pseudomonadota bacterium]
MSQRHPKIIKRYQNRKLYDTSDSCYVTLEDISEMIKQGDEVQIIDNTTKEDLTAVTLAQIIFEEQKRKTNVLPLGTFRQIIQGGGEALRELVTSGAKEFGKVREFVDDKVIPAVSRISELPQVREELDSLNRRIAAIERKLAERDRRHR